MAENSTPTVEVACPYCGAAPGDPCRTSGGTVRRSPHQARRRRVGIPPVPDHVRERLIRIIADGLRREHPGSVVTFVDADDEEQ